jgi:aspartyl aminopeptidase
MANKAMSVIDSGVAVLSMHAPYEVTSSNFRIISVLAELAVLP